VVGVVCIHRVGKVMVIAVHANLIIGVTTVTRLAANNVQFVVRTMEYVILAKIDYGDHTVKTNVIDRAFLRNVILRPANV
jgi:hypothetical protein